MNLLVKKVVLAVVACSAFASAPSVMAVTSATPGFTMHIVGSITKSTCDIRPYTTAGADATTLNLGSVVPGKASPPVSFVLKPANGCTDGITSGSSSSSAAEITWDSNGLNEQGISNMYGTASHVLIKLSPENETGSAVVETSGGTVASGSPVTTGARTVAYSTIASGGGTPAPLPFKYDVKFVSDNGGDMGAGTVSTDVSYTVAYK